jgi:hypothetical protein
MRVKILGPILALILITTFIQVIAMPVEAEWQTYNSIQAGHFVVVKDFVSRVDGGISYDVQVINPIGAKVDILLMDQRNFDLYKTGNPFTYLNVSSLNNEFAHNDTKVGDLINGLEYYLVIDNTDRPIGGASGNLDVGVECYFGGYNIQGALHWDTILMILIVASAAIFAVVYLSIILLRKLEGNNEG